MSLSHQRCLNHHNREAAVRCPRCAQFYCRECVIEHDEKFVCALCLKQLATPKRVISARFRLLAQPTQFIAGLLLVWLMFFLLGQFLVNIPEDFHEGSFWRRKLN